ncbi:MAG: 3,5-cyclic phosphodiesterase CpdA [Chlorobi bacterium]|nr:3,5-cyclic phosphodiesterase CpdA [Chlorobiota bacterium]
MRTLVHLSDIHFGRVDYATVQPLIAKVGQIAPDVMVISGDLTQRARRGQFREARAFLDALPKPQIVVPGNHDVPFYNFVARFLTPLDNYKRYISSDTEPCYSDEEIAIVGVNTARSLTFKNGRINSEQVKRIGEKFCPLDDRITKILVTHHPFDLPREFSDDDLVGGAQVAMKTLARCGADILMAGHYHISHTGDTTTRYHIPGFSALVVQAGTATSVRGRGEPNSFNVIRIEHPFVTVDRISWAVESGIFELARSERFHYGSDGWMRDDLTPAEAKAAVSEAAEAHDVVPSENAVRSTAL